MKTNNTLISALVAVTALFAPACADVSDDTGSARGEGAEDSADESEPSVDSVDSTLNSAGQYCAGYCLTGWTWVQGKQTCWGGQYIYYTYLPNVTQDCRARIVDFCHNRSWSFGDAYWTYNPNQGYRCTNL